MTQFLPPNLLALFAPREPIPFLTPSDKLPHEKKRLPYGGLNDFMTDFEVQRKKLINDILIEFDFFFRKLMKHHHQQELKQKKNELLEE
jgi:hypothetical protein